MSTTENNKLIAEFIEMQKTSIGWFDNEDVLNLPNTMDNTFDVLLFDVSWDWLMPVVEKIDKTKFVHNIDINSADTTIELTSDNIINHLIRASKIESVYKAVVEFIKWYNENKD